jgi:signal transduction histidine kinase
MMDGSPARPAAPEFVRSLREDELRARLGWFIQLRWGFLGGLGLVLLITGPLLGLSLPYGRLVTVGAIVAAYNGALYLHHRIGGRGEPPGPRAIRAEASLQIGLDLLALTALLHFSGGAENPFVFFYLFHVIIGSILLGRGEVWTLGGAAAALFLGMVGLEYAGILAHYPLPLLHGAPQHRSVDFLLAVSGALLATLFGVIAMCSSIAQSLRRRESELILARRMLLQQSADLEAANRDLKAQQERLVQSEKLASLGQLSAGIAHEINNPVQFLEGNLRIVTESMETILPLLDRHAETHPGFGVARLPYAFFREQVPAMLEDMQRGARRIADIVRDLKQFARRDEGRMDERVDLNEVVQASLRLVHNQVKRFRVVTDLDPVLPALRGSTSKLEQVVIANLINAAEALGGVAEGTIRICTRLAEDGQGIRLSIADNGPGMSEEVRRRVFDPFFTTKQRTGGTGLGLAVTYGIVREHGGQVEVESTLNEGTTFTYTFPLSPNAAGPPPSP